MKYSHYAVLAILAIAIFVSYRYLVPAHKAANTTEQPTTYVVPAKVTVKLP